MNVSAGSSIVSTISEAASSRTSGVRPQLKDAAILTVVSTAPAAGAFRPPMYGNNKTGTWNKSNLDYSILRSLAPVANTPTLAAVTASFDRAWLFYHTGPFSQWASPTTGNPSGTSGLYGREVSHVVADGVLSLHLNYTNAQKEQLFIRIVQMGIDTYGAVAFSNGSFDALAGINNGRKLPLLLAALALHDANILAYADPTQHNVFSEDQQTFMVTQPDVGRALYHADDRPRVEYLQQDVGLAEYGEQHPTSPQRDGRNWVDLAYRDITGTSFFGTVLAAQLTVGAVAAWKWTPLFDYTERYWTMPIDTLGNPIKPFHRNMWLAYRSLGDRPALAPPSNVRVTPVSN
jgi:hypothetical protein